MKLNGTTFTFKRCELIINTKCLYLRTMRHKSENKFGLMLRLNLLQKKFKELV